jgi:uncharacterized membrane protein (Fun14 family)
MSSEALLSNIVPFAGSGLLGYEIPGTRMISSAFPLVGGSAIGFGVGYVIKKLMKLAFIGLGLVMLVLGFLEYKHWISVNWTVAENQSSAIMTHVANKIATVTQHINHEGVH